MNLGFLAVLGEERPPGFYHLVLKNDLYASSGGQPVPGGRTGGRTLPDLSDEIFSSEETTLAVFPLKQEGGSDLPGEPLKVKYRFLEALSGERP